MAKDKELHEVVYFRIERTMRRVKKHTREMIKEEGFGVTIDQWIILKRIFDGPKGISQMEVSQSTFKEPAAVTRTLDLLVKKGLVRRDQAENDRRTHLLSLTPKGEQLMERMIPRVQGLRKKGLSLLAPKEVETLKNLLDKIYAGIDR